MNSPFANLFLKLIEKIDTEVSEIKFIDQDWNQLDFENPPVQFPCALIDFPETPFAQMQGYQEGEAQVRIKLIYRSFTATSSIIPAENREAALAFYEIEQKIYEALQAWNADGLLVDDLIRTNASTDKRSDGLRVRVIDFKCMFADQTVTG